MDKINETLELFNKGYNCAQSLLAVYGREFGVERSMAFRIAGPFGGGMGKCGDTCGAVTGALMVIGLKYGTDKISNRDAEKETYDKARNFIQRFRRRNGSVICRDLIGVEINSRRAKKERDEVIMGQCPKFVRDAAEIVEDLL